MVDLFDEYGISFFVVYEGKDVGMVWVNFFKYGGFFILFDFYGMVVFVYYLECICVIIKYVILEKWCGGVIYMWIFVGIVIFV